MPTPRTQGSAVRLGVISTVLYSMPRFLLGALAVQLTSDLSFGVVGLAVALAVNRVAAAIMAPIAGRVVDRIGATASIRIAATTTLISSVGIVATARDWSSLVFWLVLQAASDAMAQPGANRLLSVLVHPDRLGMALGLKQAAPPAASMLAGMSVPGLAVAFGWRSPFLLVAVLAVGVILATGWQSRASQASREAGVATRLHRRSALAALVVALGLATASTSAVTTFFVISATEVGTTESTAAIILAGASCAAVATRVVSGLLIDRFSSMLSLSGNLRGCSLLVFLGGLGLLLMANGSRIALTTGVVLALAMGWGYPAGLWYVLVRAYSDAPGRLSGAVFPGALVGSTVGPVLIGILAERVDFGAAWLAAANFSFAGATIMFFAAPAMTEPYAQHLRGE